jgi:glycosyltransferase involved in cell wall biosynthesis
MQEIPEISIVISCYNRLALLKETISSVLTQDINGWTLEAMLAKF